LISRAERRRHQRLILHPKTRMRRPIFISACISAFLLLSVVSFAGVVGVFQGRIVQPKGTKVEEGIVFVRARNGMARKVRVEKAVIEFDEDVPKSQRGTPAAKSLCENTLVRVTAEQSDKEDGEWKAINILILPDPELKLRTGAQIKLASFEQKPEESGGASAKGKGETPRLCAF
jgi:hypothetical protein